MCFGVPHNFCNFGGRVYFDDFWAWDLQLRVGFGQSMLRSGGVQPCSVVHCYRVGFRESVVERPAALQCTSLIQ